MIRQFMSQGCAEIAFRSAKLAQIAMTRPGYPGDKRGSPRRRPMPDAPAIASLNQAIQRYLDLMYDSDTSRFDRVFRPTAQLHGFRDGALSMWSAQQFKDVLDGRPSPKSLNAPREEEVLLVDVASATQAIAKVRVRINTVVFVDYLTFHRADGAWMITSKAYHVERVIAADA
jgi:hypothetical protein